MSGRVRMAAQPSSSSASASMRVARASRANQGHGTGGHTVLAIEREGLRKMRRHQMHLSAEPETARRVGVRHGRPVVFEVDGGSKASGRLSLLLLANRGCGLVDAVPPHYLRRSSA
jgi:putative RNA 2'-phosphotransferase